MTKLKRLLWGEDKTPDLRDVVALIATLAFLGFYIEYFLTGKALENVNVLTSAGIAAGSLYSKNPLLKSKTNGN